MNRLENFGYSIKVQIRKIWNGLVGTRINYQNRALGEKSRLLAVFLVIMIFIYILVDIALGRFSIHPVLYLLCYVFMAAAFLLNRYVHIYLASRIAIFTIPFLIITGILSRNPLHAGLILHFMVIGPIMGSFFLGRKGLIATGLINVAIILSIPIIIKDPVLEFSVLIYPVVSNLVTTLLLVIQMIHNERVETRRIIPQPETNLEAIFKQSPLGIMFASEGSILTDVNQAVCDLLGYSKEELIGKRIPELVHQDDRKMTNRGFLKLVANRSSSFAMEVRFNHASGRPIWVNLNISLIIADSGIPSYGIGIIEDITQRKEDQFALDVSVEKFRGFLKQSTDGISITDENYQIIEWSNGMEEITGISAETAIGQLAWDIQMQLMPAKKRQNTTVEQLKDQYKSIGQENTKVVEFEMVDVEIEKVSGSTLNLQVVTFPIRTENGVIFGSIHRDITSRVLSDQALKASENRYRTLFEYSADGISIHQGANYIDVNQTWLKMFGYSKSEVVGKTPFDFSPEYQPDGIRSDIKGEGFLTQVSRGNDQVFEWRHMRSDQSEFDVEVFMTIIEIGDKEVHISFLRDITERKQYEESLQHHVSELMVLHDVSAICLENVDEDIIISSVTKLLGDWLYQDHIGVLLMNNEKNSLEIHPSYMGLNEGDYGFDILLGQGITGQVAMKNEAIRLDDISSNPDYISPSTTHASELCVPISVNGHVYGVINAESRSPGAFSESDERLLGTVADQLALSLQKNRLYQVEKKRRLEAEARRKASSLLTASLDLDEVLDSILDNIREVINSDQASIHLFQDDHIQVVAGAGFQNKDEIIGYRYSFDNGLTSEIVDSKSPLVLEDASSDSRFENFGIVDTRGWMGVPLIEKGTVFGVLCLDSKIPSNFNQQDADLGQIFADNAAAAIVKARLFDAEKKRRLAAEIQQDISATLTSAIDLPGATANILKHLQRYLDFDTAGIFLEENGNLEIIATHGFSHPERFNNIKVSKDNILYREILNTKSIVIIDDVIVDDRFEDYGPSTDIRGWMGVPLINNSKVYGYVSFDSRDPGKFNREMGQLAQVLVNQTSSAIIKAKLFDETQLGFKRMQALHDIDQIITSSTDLSFAITQILHVVTTQLEIDAARVLIYDSASMNFNNELAVGFNHILPGNKWYLINTDHAIKVARRRQLLRIPKLDAVEDQAGNYSDLVEEGFKAYIGIPLTVKGDVKGVLELLHRSDLHTTQEWEDFLATLASQLAIAIDNNQMFENLQKTNLELTLSYEATIEGWAQALELRDMETEGHSRRVVNLTLDLARKMGIADEKLAHIRRGALLHDIGKMAVPDAILQKPGKLNDDEWEIMRQHPTYAMEWLSSTTYLIPALDIPYYHHEKWDGSGYPQGLSGEDIPVAARIFTIIDVFDALSSDRPYREAWPKDKIKKFLEAQSGIHFDPEIVPVFLAMLDNGEIH